MADEKVHCPGMARGVRKCGLILSRNQSAPDITKYPKGLVLNSAGFPCCMQAPSMSSGQGQKKDTCCIIIHMASGHPTSRLNSDVKTDIKADFNADLNNY